MGTIRWGSAEVWATWIQVRHEGLAGGHHLVAALEQVVDQPQIAAELVGDDVHGGLEDSGDGRHRAALAPQQGVLRAEGAEILHHRHAALEEGKMVGRGRRLARGTDPGRHAGQPDVQQKARRVLDQGVVLVGLHVGVVLRRLAVLEARVGRDVDARNAVVFQPDRLRHAGPAVDHVRDDGIPIELGGALAGRGEGQFVVVGHLLAGIAGVLGRELGHEGPDRHHVRLAIPHRRDIAAETGLIEALFVGGSVAWLGP